MRVIATAIAGILFGGIATTARAADDTTIAIKDHRFAPAEIELPSGQRVTLRVVNDDATPEEFESNDLNIEKVIPGHQTAVIQIGPLDAGRYEFYGEYHEDTAKGAILVK